MTAAAPDPRFRDQLAKEFGRHQGLRGPMDDERPDVWQNRCECGWDDGDERPGWRERYRQHIADALLPRVEARVQAAELEARELAQQILAMRVELDTTRAEVQTAANQRAAEELQAAATKIMQLWDSPVPAIESAFDAMVILRARAAALAPAPQTGEGA